MKTDIFSNGSAIFLILTTGFSTTTEARHSHKHGNFIGRIMGRPAARSGSSFTLAATGCKIQTSALGPQVLTYPSDFVPTLPAVTKVADLAGCHGEDCDLLSVTNVTTALSGPTPAPKAHVQTLDLQQQAVIAPAGRRHRSHHTRTVGNNALTTRIDTSDPLATSGEYCPTSLSVSPVTKFWSPVIISSTPRVLPREPNSDIEGASENFTAEYAEEDPSQRREPRDGTQHQGVLVPRQDGGYRSFVLGGFSSPSSTGVQSVAMASMTAYGGLPTLKSTTSPTSSSVSTTSSKTSSAAPTLSATASPICPDGNGTRYNSISGIEYQIVCDVDYKGSDWPFQLVNNFPECILKCDAWNYNHHEVQCIAALFVPSRAEYPNNCYLKSKLVNPSPANILVQGAIRLGFVHAISSSLGPSSAPLSPASPISQSASSSSTAQISASPTKIPTGGVTYAYGKTIIEPKVASSHLHGPTQNTPTHQYLDLKVPTGIKLSTNLLKVGVNGDLTTGYGISGQTGNLEVNISTQSHLSPLTETPHLSRDGGRGGMVNGEHLFIFCDTGSYSTTTSTSDGNFLGFVSSSVATDVGMNGLSKKVLNLQDGIGGWSDNAGRMRGFAPLTAGEMAYNQEMQGAGQRYAVWPESDIIPLDATTGIIYAPIIYDNVNRQTKAAVFTYTGATLLTITAGGKGGPVAQRTVDKMFEQDEVEWGCAGGIRSWGPSGIGGDDGKVYLFGGVAGGLLLARTTPAKVADKNSVSIPYLNLLDRLLTFIQV